MRCPVFLVAALFSSFAFLPAQAAPDCARLLKRADGSSFVLWFAQKQGSDAQLAELCLTRVPILTRGQFKPEGAKTLAAPNPVLARRAGAKHQGAALVIINIEEWKTWKTDVATIRRSVDWLMLTAAAVKEGAGGAPVGYYSMVPAFNYWDAMAGEGTGRYRRWQENNDLLRPLAEAVDALFPTVYTHYREDYERWRRYALAQVSESRRIGPGKPIYPFVWDRYHEANFSLGNGFIEPEFLAFQLEALFKAKETAGLVIWRPAKEKWLPDSNLVQALQMFLAKREAANVN
ncbi:MAG: hypothetical protein HXY22_08620 [Alphaproteobacteria bacterium]|nr:hypothetical protein [Alphaproteobacteria bacterium]